MRAGSAAVPARLFQVYITKLLLASVLQVERHNCWQMRRSHLNPTRAARRNYLAGQEGGPTKIASWGAFDPATANTSIFPVAVKVFISEIAATGKMDG